MIVSVVVLLFVEMFNIDTIIKGSKLATVNSVRSAVYRVIAIAPRTNDSRAHTALTIKAATHLSSAKPERSLDIGWTLLLPVTLSVTNLRWPCHSPMDMRSKHRDG